MVSSAEQVLIFDAFFILLLGLFGGQPNGQIGLTALQSITPPRLAPLPPGATGTACSPVDLICEAGSVAQATAYVGWAIINVPVLVIYFLSLFITFGNIVLSTVFSPSFSPNGIPIIGFFFTILQLIVVWEIFRILRGVGGLVGGTL